MSAVMVYKEDGSGPGDMITDYAAIHELMQNIGVQFEQWQANQVLADDAGQDEILAAYADDVKRLNEQFGFQSVDVVALRPDNGQKAEFRQKFLSEHTHADFEIRFFVDGHGLFYLHVDGKVYLVYCEKGDLISVPANTTHWFDMGENPNFKCIRFFTTEDGWVGDFTGSDIANHFPDFDAFCQNLS